VLDYSDATASLLRMNTSELSKKLREEARKLLKAADVLDGKNDADIEVVNSADSKEAVKGFRGTRVEQITALIKKHGPLLQKDVVRFGNIPRGTVGATLSAKYGFKKNEEGKWSLSS